MKDSKILKKQREQFIKRWSEEDYPGGTPRFQLALLAKDIVIFCLIPICAIIFYKILESSITSPKKPIEKRRETKIDRNEKHSQIIQFQKNSNGNGGVAFAKHSPGTLVRVRLLNVVETFSNAPVHAQIIDTGIGTEFMGGTLVGDATPESSTGRINIDFKYVRHPKRPDLALQISARAMSLNGTFGLEALKKEGMFARAAIRSAANNPNVVDASANNQDLKTLIARAVAAGLMQEFQSEAAVAQNNAQVLTLNPMTEFFVELTDYFPGKK